MLFRLRRTSNWGDKPEKFNPDLIIKYKIKVKKTKPYPNQTEYEYTIRLVSMRDLMDFIKAVDCHVIVHEVNDWQKLPTIEIYDDYRE